MEDCITEYVSGGHQFQRICRGNFIHGVMGDIFNSTHSIWDNYLRDYSTDFFMIRKVSDSVDTEALRIRYTPPSGQTSASLSKSTTDSPGVLTLKVNNAAIDTFNYNANTHRIDDIVTWINTHAGFVSSAQNGRGQVRASLIGGNLSTITNASCFNVDLALSGGTDIHPDWWQGHTSGAARENVLIVGNVTRDGNSPEGALFMDQPQTNDFIAKNNVWDLGYGSMILGGSSQSHVVFENNTHGAWITYANTGDPTYSCIRDNLTAAFNTNPFNNGWIGGPILTDNMHGLAGGYSAIPNAGGNSGDVVVTGLQLGGSAWTALFSDFSNGDLRPVAAGALLSNLKTKINDYDVSGTARSATDCIGAYSKNATATAWPF